MKLSELIAEAEAGSEDALARLKKLDPEPRILKRFAKSTVPALQFVAASNEQTPADALVALAERKDLGLRAALLDRPQLPEEVLLALASSEPLLLSILTRDDCPMSLLEQAARGTDPDRQLAAAENPRTPAALVDVLARNASHPAVEKALWKWAESDPERLPAFALAVSPELRTAVARHPATPPDILARLAGDADDDVRLAAAGRKELPDAVALRLLKDESPEIRNTAEMHPASRRRHRRNLWASVFAGIFVALLVIGGLVALVSYLAQTLGPQ